VESAPSHPLDARARLLVLLAMVFIAMLLLGDLLGGKIFELTLGGMPFVISVGILPFPITFLLTDLLNEFYGKRIARFITLIGFFLSLLTFLLILLVVQFPWSPMTTQTGWTGFTEASFNRIFAGSLRIFGASMVAFLIAQYTDIAVFHLLKRMTHNRQLWLRATGSTVVSQLIDTVIIQALAWGGLLPWSKLWTIMVSSYVIKLLAAVALTPAIYGVHGLVERRLGLEPVRLDAQGLEQR
jgi:uncharacterized integral membrane protein (TIGR00697 family)